MVNRARARILGLIAGIAICAGAPGPARSDLALYTGSVHFRLWERQVPYGASLSAPGLGNSPSGDLANLAGHGPAAFTLPHGQLSLRTSLFDLSPPVASLDFRSTKFTGSNDVGLFFGNGGPGPSGFTPLPTIPASQFGVSFSGGPDRFGGVMKVLGHFDWRGELAGCSSCPFHTVIPLSPIGGPFGGTAKAMTYVGGSYRPVTSVTATVWGFPWDTGTVGGVANVDMTFSPTTTSAVGTDLRSPSGLGTLQLVTPFLVQVRSRPPDCGGCETRWYYAGTARAELRFVPEPAASVLLAAGCGALAVLFHCSKQRKPPGAC
jgi:hypothetical protein